MPRRPQSIPIARWLTSHNSVLREKAETVLYHLGPDAGGVLLHAAEQESRWTHQRRALLLLPLEILCAFGLFYLIRTVSDVQFTLLLCAVSFLAVRAIWQIGEGIISRRTRLRTLALALARRNDLRSIGPMIDVWRPVGPGGLALRDDDVEHEINRLLPLFMAQNRLTLRSDKLALLRDKVRRLAPSPRRRTDLPDDRTDLLITLLQLFASTGGEKNRQVLRRLARVRAVLPNAQLIRDAAEVLLSVVAIPTEGTSTGVVPVVTLQTVARPGRVTQPVAPAAAVPLTLTRL